MRTGLVASHKRLYVALLLGAEHIHILQRDLQTVAAVLPRYS